MIEGVSSKLRGAHPYKLDPKNRVSIPAEWGPNPGGALLMLPTEKCGYEGIKVLTETQFEQTEEDIQKDPELSHWERIEIIEWMNGTCVEASINTQCKLLIPKSMCEMAKLSVDVVLVGRRGFFEIWDRKLFDKMTEERRNTVSEIRKKSNI